MKTRTIKKDLIDIEISQYDGPYSLVSLYKLSNLKIIDGIDVWVMKDVSSGQAIGLKISVYCKPDVDKKNINKEFKSHLEKMNHTYLYFKDFGKENVQEQVRDFIVALCKIEGLELGFFDFLINIPLLNKDICKEYKDQKLVDLSYEINQNERDCIKKQYKF